MFATARSALIDIADRFDAGAMSGVEAMEAVDDLGVIINIAHGLLGAVAKQVADTNGFAGTGARDAASLVARKTGTTPREIRDAIDTADKLTALPATSALAKTGQLSPRQAQMIAGAATDNPAAERSLLETASEGLTRLRDACNTASAAVQDPAERSAKQRKTRHYDLWSKGDGMGAGFHELPPEEFGALKAVVEQEAQRIFRERRAGKDHEPLSAYMADALVNLVLGRMNADGVRVQEAREIVYHVHVVVDHGLLTGTYDLEGAKCEIPGVGPVDVNWVRSILGDAFLTAVIQKGVDITTVAHLGRHVPAEIMTALIVRGRECDEEDCDHRGYLERDHVHDFAKGGLTAFWNLIWLCYFHHRLKTSGWILGPPDTRTGKRKLRPPPARAA